MCEHHLAGDPTGLPCERTTDHTPGQGCIYTSQTGSDLDDRQHRRRPRLMATHQVVDNDPRNPHGGDNPDCTGTLCPACGCCMHCVPGSCGCTVTDCCTDRQCLCPAVTEASA